MSDLLPVCYVPCKGVCNITSCQVIRGQPGEILMRFYISNRYLYDTPNSKRCMGVSWGYVNIVWGRVMLQLAGQIFWQNMENCALRH